MLAIVTEIIKTRNFINVATCDAHGMPNGVSKLIVRIHGNMLFLVDYAVSRTYANLKHNPRVSLSFFDVESLKGFQINGPVEIIEAGPQYEELTSHLSAKEVSLATERVIRGMTRGKPHAEYEMGKARKFVFFRVRMDEIAEISYSGEVKREISPR